MQKMRNETSVASAAFVALHALFAPPPPQDVPVAAACVAPTVAAFDEALEQYLASRPSLAVAELLAVSLERHTTQTALLKVLAEHSEHNSTSVALLLHCWFVMGPPVEAGEAAAAFAALRDALLLQGTGSHVELLMRACREQKEESNALPSELTPPVREAPQAQSVMWQVMHPHALAAQLTAMDESFMEGLTSSDVMLGRSLSESGRMYEAWLQRCPLWVATEIVMADEKDRPKVIIYYLKVVVRLREIRNVNSFALVMEGLRYEAVQRLTASWSQVLSVHNESWEELVRDALPAQLLALRKAPTIPFVGLMQREVMQVLLDTQMGDSRASCIGDGAVNWVAEVRIQNATRGWLDNKRRRLHVYGIVPHAATLSHLREGARVLNSSQLGVFSRLFQPENQTLSDAVRSSGGIVSGFSSWFKNSPAEEVKRSLQDAVFLPGAEWSEIFARSETLKYGQQGVVVEKGKGNTFLWRVKKGAVSAVSEEGFIVGTLGENQVFGEVSMVRPLGLAMPVAMLSVSPACEVQRVPFVVVATVLKAQIELRVSFYRALSAGMSNRGQDVDFAAAPAPPSTPQDASVKFFNRFEMKNEEIVAKFACSWTASCRLTAQGKLFVTKRVVAVIGSAWSATFRWVAALSEVALFPGDKVLRIVAGARVMVLRVDSPEKVLLAIGSSKEFVSVPPLDNRSWDLLVVSGARSVVLQKGQEVTAAEAELFWIARGECVCKDNGQLLVPGSSYGDGSFFSLRPFARKLVAQSETAHLLILSWSFLNVLSVTRPDVASNFFRLTSATIAERLIARDPLAAAAVALTKQQ